MTSPNFCADGGYVVGARRVLAEDPTEFFSPDLPDTIGCNQLLCQRCGEGVRSAVGVVPKKGVTPSQIFDAADWESSPKLLQTERAPIVNRFYCCRCTYWLENSEHATEDPDRDPIDPVFPWRCGGHPIVSVPFDLDGETIDASTDFEELCRRVFTKGAPPDAREAEHTITGWIQKLYVRLTGSPVADKVSTAIAGLLADDDTQLRGCALVFFSLFPGASGADQVARLARNQLDLFEGTNDPTHPSWSLVDRLADTLGHRVRIRGADRKPIDGLALEVAREMALAPAESTQLLPGLVDADRQWVLDHAPDIARAGSDGWTRLLDAYRYRDPERLGNVAKALVAADAVDTEDLRQYADDKLFGFTKKLVLSAT